MKIFETSLGRILTNSAAVSRSNGPSKLKWRIQKAACALEIPQKNPASLMGYKIGYSTIEQLRFLFREIFCDQSYFFEADSNTPLIIDCGSNIGMSILYFKSLYPNARIIGFEPEPVNFGLLEDNIRRNSLRDTIVYNCALGDKEGKIDFYCEDVSGNPFATLTSSALIQRAAQGKPIAVTSARLSSFLTEPIDLLKMDIEGAEVKVMDELASSGALDRVKRMHVEYHHHIDSAIDNLSQFLGLVETHGFGYQLQTDRRRGAAPRRFQDISLYCYRK